MRFSPPSFNEANIHHVSRTGEKQNARSVGGRAKEAKNTLHGSVGEDRSVSTSGEEQSARSGEEHRYVCTAG
eukprot:197241-Rhodomonas_salina.1